jgi:hypothetical protein
MGKTNRTEVVKRLTQEIEVTTDPKTLIELSRQLVKLLPKPKQVRGRPRKVAEEPKKNLPLPDGKQVLNRLVLKVEAKCKVRGGWSALMRADKDTLLAEATKSLSAEECEALEALNTEKVV